MRTRPPRRSSASAPGRDVEDMVMLTLGTGSEAVRSSTGGSTRGWAEFGHIVVVFDGPPCQGSSPDAAISSPRHRRRGGERQEEFGPAVDAHRLVSLGPRRRAARGVLDGIGRHLGAGIGSLVNIFNPELVVSAAASAPRATSSWSGSRARAARRSRRRTVGSASCARSSGPRQAWSAPARRVRARWNSRALAVCATPIGISTTSRCACSRSCAPPTVLCEDTRHTRVLLERHGSQRGVLSYHEHNEAARTAEFLPRLRAGRARGAGPTRACRGSATRVRGSWPRRSRRAWPSPSSGRVRRGHGAGGQRSPGRAYQFLGFLPRGGQRPSGGTFGWRHPVVAFESPRRLPAAAIAGRGPA